MTSVNPNAKQKKIKPPKSRPLATSALSQPVTQTQQAGTLATLAAFSPKANHFALLSLAVDRHRLRIYDTATAQANAEYIVEPARATCLHWMEIHSDPAEAQKKKKKKKRDSAASTSEKSKTQVVALGLSSGAITFFSPAHGSPILTLSNSASNTAILDTVLDASEDRLWSSSEDASIYLWDMSSNTILRTWKSDDRIPYTCISLEPRVMDESDRPVGLLAAHNAAKLLSINLSSESASSKPTIFASFSGHTTPISHIAWTTSKQFVTVAQGDKFVQGWTMPKNGGVGTVAFSAALDAEARKAYVSPSGELIVATSVSGAISIFRIPSQYIPASNLAPESVVNISIARGKGLAENADVIDAVFSTDSPGLIHVARIIAGVRPAFETVPFVNDEGDIIPEIKLKRKDASLSAQQEDGLIINTRYKEYSAKIGTTGPLEEPTTPFAVTDGALDVDLAELSLGQRLRISKGDEGALSDSDFSTTSVERGESKVQASKHKRTGSGNTNSKELRVPTTSLAQTLTQALHSSDTRLLEACFAHKDGTLIMNTVRRIPPQLALVLLDACVERLGRGRKGNAGTGKGRGGGVGSQRGEGLVRWMKSVLVVHGGSLMTMPDLVARLSSLHATLTARLALQERLLTLSGRLELVLAQIELQSSRAPAPLVPRSDQGKKGQASNMRRPTRYVEGESTDEDEMDVEIEQGSGEDGSDVEEIGLGGSESSGSGVDLGDEDEDEELEGSNASDGETGNALIDDEAEEDWGSDEEEDDDDDDDE